MLQGQRSTHTSSAHITYNKRTSERARLLLMDRVVAISLAVCLPPDRPRVLEKLN